MSNQQSETIEIIVRNIKRLRAINGWNQTQLAEKAGINASYISRVEKADRKLSLETVEKIAHGFGIQAYELLKPHNVEEMTLRDKVQEIESLEPLKKMMIEQMVDAFIKEKNID